MHIQYLLLPFICPPVPDDDEGGEGGDDWKGKGKDHPKSDHPKDHPKPDHNPDHESDHKPDYNSDYKRRSNTLGPLFDGSFGIDTEDLANTPGIDFSTLQYFPHQNTNSPDGDIIDLTDPCNIAQSGVDWVELHGKTGNS